MTAGRRTAPQPTGPERADRAPVRPYRPPGVIVVTAESDGLTAGKARRRGRPGPLALSVVVVLALAACGGTDAGADPAPEAGQTEPITLYTCLSDERSSRFSRPSRSSEDGGPVDLFRAPTGELNARMAADVRSGGLHADVFWGCDPLTMQAFVEQDLVGGWTPPEADAIPAEYRTEDSSVRTCSTWWPCTAPTSRLRRHGPTWPAPRTRGVRFPTRPWPPRLSARSDSSPDRRLRRRLLPRPAEHGAVQVSTPDDVTTGVAQGIYDAGITTANSAYAAKENGSPMDVVWPEPGAVAIYGPVALATDSADSAGRESLHLLRRQRGGPGGARRVRLLPDPSRACPARRSRTGPRPSPPTGPRSGRTGTRSSRDYQQVFGG